MQLHCTGLCDLQINQYLALRGFKDIGVGYAAMKGDIIFVKSGFVRLLVSPDHKRYAIPNSMTCEDWATINAFRTLCQKKLAVFITREYVFPKFLKKRGRQAPIPTDREIIDSYCTHKVVTDNVEEWDFRPAHSALLLIDGTKFRLYDANGFADLKKPASFFVRDFLKIFKRRGLPHVYRALGLKAKDAKDYAVENCYVPKG